MMQPELKLLLNGGGVSDIGAIPVLPVDSRRCRGGLEQGGGDSGSPFTFSPTRIQLNKEHEIFEEGDVRRHLYLQDLSSAATEDPPKLCVSVFGCHISGCTQLFSSVAEYEHHYSALHRHVCCSCRRALPSARLLDIHVQEWHDALFALLAQRQDMYQCLVEGCDLMFRTSSQRKDHLIKIHKYPSDFRFDKAKKSKRTKESKPPHPRESPMEVSGGVCVSRGAGGPVCEEDVLGHPEEEGESMEVPLPQEQAASLAAEAASSVPSETNTEHPADSSPSPVALETQKPRYSYRVPASVCFGQGSVRGFRGRGRRK